MGAQYSRGEVDRLPPKLGTVPIYLVRHGETEWTKTHRHTGATDVALSARGEEQARQLRSRLAGINFSRVVVSPKQRAIRTAELAGLADRAEVNPDLVEYDYGAFEGLTTDQIHSRRPGWELWRDGCPGGESPAAVLTRASRLLDELRLSPDEDSLLFGHGHMLRAVAAAYLGLNVGFCRHLIVGVASISILGSEHDQPAIEAWNLS